MTAYDITATVIGVTFGLMAVAPSLTRKGKP